MQEKKHATESSSPGAQIRAAREAKDMRGEDLARLVGVTKQTIARWESGEDAVSGRYLADLSRALGVPVEKLVAPRRPARSVPSSPDGSRQPMPNWVEDLVDMSTETDELREAWEKVHRLWVMSRKPRADMSKENWRHLLKQTRSLMFEAEAVDFPSRKPPKGRRDRAAGEED